MTAYGVPNETPARSPVRSSCSKANDWRFCGRKWSHCEAARQPDGRACDCLPSAQSQDHKFLLDFDCDSREKGIYLAVLESENVNTILVYLAKAWDSPELYGLSTQGSNIVLTS
jgi:hypothetical protein